MSIAECNYSGGVLMPDSTATSSDSKKLFQELLDRLKECHDTTVQGLQSKVNKLRKERCFDAQRLKEFCTKNQQLRDQQKTLQASIQVLNDRLQSGPCHLCKENAKHIKENQHNQQLVNNIKAERDMLKKENRKLTLELEQIRGQSFQHTSFSEPEEGMIPDSPLQSICLSVVNKMKRKKDQSHIRYAERLLSQPLHGEPNHCKGEPNHCKGEPAMSVSCNGEAVLAPETCDLDVTNASDNICGKAVVAETCRIDLDCDQDSESDVDSQMSVHTVHKQAQMEMESNICQRAKQHDMWKNYDRPKSGKHVGQINVQEQYKRNLWESEQTRPDCCPSCTPHKSPLLSQNYSRHEQSWSLDPGTTLSQYVTDSPPQSEPRIQAATVDTDCTYVSHSLLLPFRKQTKVDQTNSMTGICQKANDSLANIFDTTSAEDYESCPQDEMSALERNHDQESNEKEGHKDQDKQDMKMDKTELMSDDFYKTSTQPRDNTSEDNAEKSFACMVVVRKKSERRKLQGHTCKECDIYYADLPEEEKKKKLSSCSRHRFRYIPPSTPDNFWEVGFPSTQTCRERGYIKDDSQPDPRSRRRKPYLATFSPKVKPSK
ncbi:DNA endonuclease RBBP8 [Trichomycterus rosablanca]|uniref:DNA endonuclease RBBP8 n=1 Tax=Trichomycterus rosablanca TaxID=2290929 RepID=UPI002F35F2FE